MLGAQVPPVVPSEVFELEFSNQSAPVQFSKFRTVVNTNCSIFPCIVQFVKRAKTWKMSRQGLHLRVIKAPSYLLSRS